MRKSIIRLSSVVLAVILVSSITWLVQHQSNHKTLAQQAAPTVSVAAINSSTYQAKLNAIGYFTANQAITLKSSVDATISKINFKSGQQVKQDTVLVEFDHAKEAGALAYAKARYALSQLTYQRNTRLETSGAVSEEALDEAKSALQSDLASVQQAQADYDKTFIKAPFSGTVGLKNISIGDYLTAGDAVVSLQSLDPMYIDFTVPEQYLSQIQHGQQVMVQANTLPNQTLIGMVESYEPVINADTGMITVRASVPNDQHELLPNGYAEVVLYLGDSEQIITVPETALSYDVTGNYVFLVQDNQVTKQVVTVGQQVGQRIAITQGLHVGDQIVTAGTNKLHNGSDITIAKTITDTNTNTNTVASDNNLNNKTGSVT